ncbi:MAG TPA: TetR/AcrR family transcriptional regulator [Solirubrobacterales bacterium]|nr:TetR/AcrR family transcriptional regulator [Solirubrobacterales bacterium]
MSSPKRQRILEGMLEAVGTSGYDAASVRTVLDNTGLYRQAFYDNFADKEECYLEAFDFGVAQLEALVKSAAQAEPTWQGKLRAGLRAFLEALDADPVLGRALVVEVHAAGPEALRIRSESMKRTADFIDSARVGLEGGESPPPIAAEGIVAGMHAVVHGKLAAGEESGFRELLPDFMYFAVLPYFGSDVAGEEMKRATTA